MKKYLVAIVSVMLLGSLAFAASGSSELLNINSGSNENADNSGNSGRGNNDNMNEMMEDMGEQMNEMMNADEMITDAITETEGSGSDSGPDFRSNSDSFDSAEETISSSSIDDEAKDNEIEEIEDIEEIDDELDEIDDLDEIDERDIEEIDDELDEIDDLDEIDELNEIEGMKFHDADMDGVKDENEPGLANWTITISGVNMTASAATDEDGEYEFENLTNGTYTVCEVLQSGWIQTFPTTGPSCPTGIGHTITLPNMTNNEDEDEVEDVDFGNAMIGVQNSISGMKFNDLNHDGVKDANESGLSGWTITLNGGVSSTTVTDANGEYEFTGIPDGTFTVCEALQAGWMQTFPTSGPNCTTGIGHSVNITNNSVPNIDFGNKQDQPMVNGTGRVEIIKKSIGGAGTFGFNGTAGDFQITTQLAEPSAGVHLGSKTFMNVAAGTISITETPQAGFTQALAKCTDGSSPSSLSLSAGEHVVCVFVNQKI